MKRLFKLLLFSLFLFVAPSVFATQITVNSQQVSNWQRSAPHIRVFLNHGFTTSTGTQLLASSPQQGIAYLDITCTLLSNTVTVPTFTIDSTIDGLDYKLATFSFYWYVGSSQVAPVDGMLNLRIPNQPTPTTWVAIKLYNQSTSPTPPIATYYNVDQVNALIAALSLGTGTVTSVGTTAPITGGPFTTSGTIGITDFVASGASHARGAVPDPGASSGTTKFLREDATWAIPSGTGTGTVTSVSVVTANGVSGSVANPTTTPAITLTLGDITPTTVNGNTLTTGTFTLTGAASKTLTFNKSITLEGTDSTTMTFPSTSATIARTDAGQTFTGVNTMTSPVFITPTLGVASATSINKITITAPASSATLTLADGSSLIRSGAHALTLTTTGASNVTFPASGTLLTTAATSLPSLATVGTITSGTLAGGATLGAVTMDVAGADASGDMYYRNSSGVLTRIPAGALGTFLAMGGSSVPFWTTGGSGPPAGSDTQVQYNASGFFSGATGVLTSGTGLTVRGALNSCSDAGSTDDYACSLSPTVAAYADGQVFWFKANTANTGAATLNLNSLGAKAIKKVVGGITTALDSNDIRAGQWVAVQYDGTNFQMQSVLGNAASGSIVVGTTPITSGTATRLLYETSGNVVGEISGATSDGTTLTMTSPAVTTSLTTGSTTFALLNTTATTVNAFGAATTLNLGASATMVLNFGGAATASEFRFLEPSGSGTNYTAFKAVAQAANITYSLPATVGAAGTVLTDAAGDGVLSWAAGGGGGTPGGSNTQVQFNNSSSFGGSANLTWVSPALSIGAASSATGQLKLLNSSNANVLTLQPGATGSALTFTLPTADASGGNDCLRSNEAGVLSFGACAGAATAGTMLEFTALANEPPATNFATLDTRNAEALLAFDASTNWDAIFSGVLPTRYTGNGLTVTLVWAAASATSGDVVWNAAIERQQDGVDTIASDSFAAAQAATCTAPGTSGIVQYCTITFTSGAQMDSLAAGESFRIKVTRNAAAGGDTMTGNAQLTRVAIKETP